MAIEKDILEVQGNSHIWVIKERIKENRPSLYQIKVGRGPWTEICRVINENLSNTQKLQEDNEKLSAKIKESLSQVSVAKKEKEQQSLIITELQKQVNELKMQINEFSAMVDEKKRLD